jgi:hypothetical protein
MVIVDTPHGAVVLDWRGLWLLFGRVNFFEPHAMLPLLLSHAQCFAYLFGRGCHKMDPEKICKRLYGSFVNRPGKPEGDTTGPQGEDNTQEENNGGTDRR